MTLFSGKEPEAFSQFKEGQLVTLYTETRPLAETGKMPMVVGKSMKEALRILGEWDVQVEVEGGIVIKQLPVAGSKMDNSGKIKLICNPA
ncbi:MAG: PASTA domain-containing protein [Calditrichia bacterium]